MRFRQAKKLWTKCRVKITTDGISVSVAAKYVNRKTRQASLARISRYEKKNKVSFFELDEEKPDPFITEDMPF